MMQVLFAAKRFQVRCGLCGNTRRALVSMKQAILDAQSANWRRFDGEWWCPNCQGMISRLHEDPK